MSQILINNVESYRKNEPAKDVLERARGRHHTAEEFYSGIHEKALEDFKFLENDQWLAKDIMLREAKNRPYLTFNRLSTFVDQIVGDQQQAAYSVSFSPVAYKGLPFNDTDNKQYSVSKVREGIFKSIEMRSMSVRARNMAFEQAVSGGFGYYRVLNDYESETSFDQEIYVTPIYNPFMVKLDPVAIFMGPQHANWAFVDDIVPYEDFINRYPDAQHYKGNSTSDLRGMGLHGWYLEEGVRVTEYFERSTVDTEMVQLSDGGIYKLEDYERRIDEFDSQGIGPVRMKTVKLIKVFWYLLAGDEVLDGPVEFPSRYIPIIPVYGKLRVVDGEPHLRGAIRYAKDAQRLYNYSETTTAELISNAPKNQWVIDWDAVPEALREDYKKANLDSLPALYYSGSRGNAPVTQPPPQIQAGFSQLTDRAWENIKGTVGMFNESIGDQGPLISGKAVSLRQSESEVVSYPFIQNFSMSIEYEALLINDMSPRIYDTNRVMKLTFSEDVEAYLEINRVDWNAQEERFIVSNEMTPVDFTTAVHVGPSAKTQRIEAVDSMTRALEVAAPADARLAVPMLKIIADNSDWTGARDFSKMLTRLMPPEMQDLEQQDSNKIPKEQVQMLIEQAVQQAMQQAGVEIEKMNAMSDQITAEAKRIKAMADMLEAKTAAFEAKNPKPEPSPAE